MEYQTMFDFDMKTEVHEVQTLINRIRNYVDWGETPNPTTRQHLKNEVEKLIERCEDD